MYPDEYVKDGAGPGELPVARKWAHVRDALDRWKAGEAFDAFDARWDVAKVLFDDEGASR